MPAFRTLPVRIAVAPASAEAVASTSVNCGYVWSSKNLKRSALAGTLPAAGGVLDGVLEADALGQFATTAAVELVTLFHPETGLLPHVVSDPSVAVTGAGLLKSYAAPKVDPRTITLLFSLPGMAPDESFLVSWQYLTRPASGQPPIVAREGLQSVQGTPVGSPQGPRPASTVIRVVLHDAVVDPTLRIRAVATSATLNARALQPFDQTVSLAGAPFQQATLTWTPVAGPGAPLPCKFVLTTT
jgi:hypothetical protein